jgi:hypothetical protein
MSLNTRGTALAELLVAAVLTAALMTAALDALSFLQRSVTRQASRTTSAHTLRAAAQLFRSELRDLSPPAGDLMSVTTSSLVYRAVRGTGAACATSPDGLHIQASSFRTLRLPAADRDSLLIVRPGTAPPVSAAVTGDPGPGVCPDGRPALVVPYAAVPDPLTGVSWPALVWLTEVMEIRAYQSGAEWWLGLRSIGAGEVIQPALGPLASNGLLFMALDSSGTSTGSLTDVRRLEILLRLASADSLQTTVPFAAGWP